MLGAALVVAAALKGDVLVRGSGGAAAGLENKWLGAALVVFEAGLGVALLGGRQARRIRQAAALFFAALACVSLGQALSGYTSCGCFGQVAVSPWLTLAFDLAAVAALVLRGPRHAGGAGPHARSWRRVGAAFAVAGASLLVGALAVRLHAWGTTDDREPVVIEPAALVGKEFPLLPYIDVGAQLSRGEWAVVLYRSECGRCDDALRHLEDRVPDGGAVRSHRLAAIEVPPHGSSGAAPTLSQRVVWGRLGDTQRWVVSTPTCFALVGGTVVDAGGEVVFP